MLDMNSNNKVYKKNPDFVQREVAGEYILVPIKRNLNDSNSIYVLNLTGAQIWKQFDGTKSVQQIQETLRNEFEVEEAVLDQDLSTLCKDLLSIEAITEKN